MAPPNRSLQADEVRSYVSAAKKQLRAQMRALRQALPESCWQARSRAICERLLAHPAFVSPRGVALFWPMVNRREIDLRGLDAELRQRGIPICYPFMERSEDGSYLTGFRWVKDTTELQERGHRFAEPPPEAPLATRGEVTVVVVPALGVAMDGSRLGYGAGFYDATLPDVCPPAQSIVVAYDFQRLLEIPRESHDFACDFVVTDATCAD